MKAAAELIMHPALGHRAQCDEDHIARVFGPCGGAVSQEKIQDAGPWELGRRAESTQARVERPAKRMERCIERVLADCTRASASLAVLLELFDHLCAGLLDLVAFVAPGPREALEDCAESRPAVTGIGRKIR